MNYRIDLNKKSGITSQKAVRDLMNLLGEKKAGHSGTLDPQATGVLNVYFNTATKFIDRLNSKKKTYIADIQFGKSSDTLDIWGEVKDEFLPEITNKKINKVLSAFRGEILQEPPMYSALRYKGKRLYDYAREGIEVKRKKRIVEIFFIDLIYFNKDSARIIVTVSKGTYIRSLIDDIAKKLNTRAVMSGLRRIVNDEVHITASYSIDEIKTFMENNDYRFKRGISFSRDIQKYNITPLNYYKAINGQIKSISTDIEDIDLIGLFLNSKFVGTAYIKQKRLFFDKLIKVENESKQL